MREWDEITRDILIRRDEKIAQKKARMHVVKRTALSALCFCLISTAGIGIWKNIPERTKPAKEGNDKQLITDVTSTVSTLTSVSVTSSSVENKVTYTHAETSTASTNASKLPLTTSASTSRTASTSTSVTQSIAVTSSILAVSQSTTQTNVPENTITTDIEVIKNDNERSLIMKKFFAALAAASTMVNPITANASPIIRFSPQEDYLIINEADLERYETGELVSDVNGDGVFDVYDLHYAYVNNESCADNLYYYYLKKNGFKPEDFDINNFKEEDGSISEKTWFFYDWLSDYYVPNLKYDMLVKYDQENNISLDFNEDGVTDVRDCLDYWMFQEYMEWKLNDEYAEELRNKYGVNPDSFAWGIPHRLDSILGIESPDLGFSIPNEEYMIDIPMKETTLKNCAQYFCDHRFIGISCHPGACLLTREFINFYDFSEQWLDPEYCSDYLYSTVDKETAEDLRFKETVEDISGTKKYEYRYMGEARVDAIEAGLVKYEDYCDILSWHSKNELVLSSTYPEYEKAVQEGSTSKPDMNKDGKLDDSDMEILASCYKAILYDGNDISAIIDDVKNWCLLENWYHLHYDLADLERPQWTPDGDAIAALDSNNNGIICDDFDILFAGIYISKNGDVDFDLYSEFFASEFYETYDERTWKYYDRTSARYSNNFSEGIYYDYIIAIADLLFDMDKANGTAPDAASYPVPYRSGDATTDGQTNIGDAVLIMQSICNPAKYKLSMRGEFNADVNNTNDGITSKDALVIQRRLVGLE